MAEIMMGLYKERTFKLEDRRKIALRVLGALLLDPDCRFDFRGIWVNLTIAEQANWDARQTLVDIIDAFPVPADPFSQIEPPDNNLVDEPTEQ